MASLKGPLMSFDASGQVGGAIVFAKWKGRNYVRRLVTPSNPNTLAQIGARAIVKFVSQDYANLSAGDIADWQALAVSDNITPLNAQLRDSANRFRAGDMGRQNTTDTAITTPNAPTAGTATALPAALRVGWTAPAANPGDYCYVLYASTVTGFTTSSATIRAIVAYAKTSVDVNGLESGTPYYFRVRATTTSGQAGALLAQWTGTPS